MAVLDPIKLVITRTIPKAKSRGVGRRSSIPMHAAESGTRRKVPFARELCIERDDFMEDPPSKFFRLAPGQRGAACAPPTSLRCEEVVKDASTATVSELRSAPTIPRRAADKIAPDGRKVKATIHWVSAKARCRREVRVYDRLFANESPDSGGRKLP